MKGIVLAGGRGSRLWPLTGVLSKQLLPVYDKPMIYYPISTLMLAGVRDILIITTPEDQNIFKKLLGNGEQFGVRFEYASQPKPEGLAQALIIAKDFICSGSCLLILGDNIFHGAGLGHELARIFHDQGAHIFTTEVANPSSYGILSLDNSGQPMKIEEKPLNSSSNLAVTGMYFFDHQASNFAEKVQPSSRGELEITSVIEQYLKIDALSHTHLSRGSAWLDTGNINSMHDASTFVRVLEERTGLKIACLEEIALQNGWITKKDIMKKIEKLNPSNYVEYLKKISS